MLPLDRGVNWKFVTSYISQPRKTRPQICKASSKQHKGGRKGKKYFWGQSSPLPQMPLVLDCLLLEPPHVSTLVTRGNPGPPRQPRPRSSFVGLAQTRPAHCRTVPRPDPRSSCLSEANMWPEWLRFWGRGARRRRMTYDVAEIQCLNWIQNTEDVTCILPGCPVIVVRLVCLSYPLHKLRLLMKNNFSWPSKPPGRLGNNFEETSGSELDRKTSADVLCFSFIYS